MSVYKGFISRKKFIELRDELRRLFEFRGIENILEHMYQPDTDGNDKIIENLEEQKEFLVMDLLRKISDLGFYISKIKELKRGE